MLKQKTKITDKKSKLQKLRFGMSGKNTKDNKNKILDVESD